jgi:hypothetical protein
MMMKHRMMMDCGMGPHHGPGMNHGPCMGRHFVTKEERMELLEEYKKWLEKEAKGVEEFIADLKKE